jgi:hypothetical protein
LKKRWLDISSRVEIEIIEKETITQYPISMILIQILVTVGSMLPRF